MMQQRFNLQNTLAIHTGQEQKNKTTQSKMGREPKQTFLQRPPSHLGSPRRHREGQEAHRMTLISDNY